MLNMMPLSRDMLSLQTGLPRQFYTGNCYPAYTGPHSTAAGEATPSNMLRYGRGSGTVAIRRFGSWSPCHRHHLSSRIGSPCPRAVEQTGNLQLILGMGMVRRTTMVPRVPLRTRPRDPLPTGDLQPPQPPSSRPLRRSKDIQTHLPQFPLARPPTNGERLCGILPHMCMCKVSKTQTLQKVETTSNTLPTMVVYLDGLHQTTSSLQGLLHYPSSC